jgi:RNA polymerase sigma-70 factor (ECF subfamily)
MPEPQPGTSLTLLQRLRDKEPAAWQTMVQLYTALVYHWCGKGGVRGADADDVAQEVFQAAAAHLADFRRERADDTFRGWLRGITRHKLLDHYRRRDRQVAGDGGSDALVRLQEVAASTILPEDEDTAGETGGLYRRALELIRSEFEERTWQMFWRTLIDERSPVDVAAEMGVTPAAVRKAKSRVLHRLKEHFGDLLH